MAKNEFGIVEIKCSNCGFIGQEVFDPVKVYNDKECPKCFEPTIRAKRVRKAISKKETNKEIVKRYIEVKAEVFFQINTFQDILEDFLEYYLGVYRGEY